MGKGEWFLNQLTRTFYAEDTHPTVCQKAKVKLSSALAGYEAEDWGVNLGNGATNY